MGEPFGTGPATLAAGAAGGVVTTVGVALLAARPEHVPAVPRLAAPARV
jgi:hypothetical protein